MKTVREERLKSNERANELETNLEATKSYVYELQEDLQAEIENSSRKEKEMISLQQRLRTFAEMEKVTHSKEKDWEIHVKEVDELRTKVSDLEHSLSMKRFYIDNLEKKLTSCGNTEIASLFKRKVTNDRKQSEECRVLKEIRRKKIHGEH